MITRYREGRPADQAILRTDRDVTAYAAYRMPATYAAVHAALAATATRLPDFAPRTMVDVGGGTGAALWAAVERWPTLTDLSVIEQAPSAVSLGRRLMTSAANPALRRAHWAQALIDPNLPSPSADLITMSYVLGELPEQVRDSVTSWLPRRAGVLLIIEPGTPAGYRRIAVARERLVGEGYGIVAPCAHQRTCPIPADDWCHFASRLPRSGTHRLLKDAALNYEDEKFSYLAVTSSPVPGPGGRILRHPRKRKGLVTLTLCTSEAAMRETSVAKSVGHAYRDARAADWGDQWPLKP